MKKLLIVIVTCVLALAACGGPTFKGSPVQDSPPAPDFTLTDQNGQPFRMSEQRNRVTVLLFGYTFCPDECPTSLVTFKQAQQLLGADGAKVRFVLITVDPDRDTAERLKQYLNVFSPDFIGLRGAPSELQAVYKAYGVFVEKGQPEPGASGYAVTHTVAAFMIDPAGRWRVMESYNTPPEDLASDIRILLKG